MLKNNCKICRKLCKDKTCSKTCRNVLNILRRSCKDCYLLDIKYFLSKYKQDEAYRKYKYIKNFEAFLMNKIIYNNVPILEYIQVLNNIEDEKININSFKKHNVPNNKNQWIVLGFSNLTAEIIAKLFSTSRDSFISRCGLIEGNNKYRKWRNKSKTKRIEKGYPKEDVCFSKEYWIKKGCSKDEALSKIKKLNTRNLEYFVEKYGEENGKLKYNKMNSKKSISNSKEGFVKNHGLKQWNTVIKKKIINLDFFVKKYGEVEGRKKYREYTKNRLRRSIKSKPALKLENYIKNDFTNIYDEFLVKGLLFDYKINGKVLIEVNGDWWHMNPNKYDENTFNKVVGEFAKNIWKIDLNKRKLANDLGYSVIYIWECSINKKIEKVKDKILESVTLINKSGKILNFDMNLKNNEFEIKMEEYNG